MKITDNSSPERKEAIKQLYFLAEELKSYTDLTGSRFDIDNAQRRLWLMQAIVKKNDLSDINSLYDTLSEQLDVPSFFDKVSFSKSLDDLYTLLHSMKEEADL